MKIKKVALPSLMIMVLFATSVNSGFCAAPPSTPLLPQQAATTPSQPPLPQSSTDEKIGRIDGRVDELAKRMEAFGSGVSSTAQLVLEDGRYQMRALAWIIGILFTVLTGSGLAAAGYVYKTYKDIENRTVSNIKDWETKCDTLTTQVNSELERFRNEILPLQRNQVGEIHFVLGWIATYEWKEGPFKSPAVLDRAIQHFKIGLEGNPPNNTIKAQLLTYKAWAEKRLGRYKKATDSMAQARAILPENLTYAYNHACYTKLSGDLAGGFRLLREAVQRDSKFKTVALQDEDWKDVLGLEEFKQIVS